MTEPQVNVVLSALSDVGRQRTHNEDALIVADLSFDPLVDGVREPVSELDRRSARFDLGPNGLLLVVADGMGGAQAGEVASRMAVEGIYEELVTHWVADETSTPERFTACIVDALGETNARIFEAAQRNVDRQGMGTTATVVGLLEDTLYVAQVGDSRAYLVRDGVAIQLTRDQSVVEHLVRAGRLTKEQADRSTRKNVLLQAMGTTEMLDVDVSHQSMRSGDTLVLCSDGLSGDVEPEEIADLTTASGDPAVACAELIALANARGGRDNITVIVARVAGPGLIDPVEGDQVGHFTYPLIDPPV